MMVRQLGHVCFQTPDGMSIHRGSTERSSGEDGGATGTPLFLARNGIASVDGNSKSVTLEVGSS